MSITNKEIATLFDGEHECGVHTLQVSHIYLNTIRKIVTYHGKWDGVCHYKLSPSVRAHGNSYMLVSPDKMPAVFRDLTENQEVRVERPRMRGTDCCQHELILHLTTIPAIIWHFMRSTAYCYSFLR